MKYSVLEKLLKQAGCYALKEGQTIRYGLARVPDRNFR